MGDSSPSQLVVEAAESVERELKQNGTWSRAQDGELDALFESAARQALRAPSLIERSIRLRRVAKSVIPASLRPMLRGALRHGETRLRAILDRKVNH